MASDAANPGQGETLKDWMMGRVPRVPAAFLPHFRDLEKRIGGKPAGLAEAGTGAIGEALETHGEARRAAFHLLVGDALLTYACEAAAEEDDPHSTLHALLTGLGDEFR